MCPVVGVGTTAITFTELNKQTAISGTPGQIVVSANTISIDPAYVGQTSITTLGVVSVGSWQGSVIGVPYGGTGASTPAGARANILATGKYQALIGNGSLTTIPIPRSTHLLAATSRSTSRSTTRRTRIRSTPTSSWTPRAATCRSSSPRPRRRINIVLC